MSQFPVRSPELQDQTTAILEFEKASFRYRDNIPDVLKDLKLKMFQGEKIGIVGRTGIILFTRYKGAGKSSLTLGISKIIDLTAGRMMVGGENAANMKLRKLRSMISVIP